MNNLKKIGLSALAGSLVAFSANAGEMTVTGGAQLFMSSSDKVGKTTLYNNFLFTCNEEFNKNK